MDSVVDRLETVTGDRLSSLRGRMVAEIWPFVQESHHQVCPMLQLSALRTKSAIYNTGKQPSNTR